MTVFATVPSLGVTHHAVHYRSAVDCIKILIHTLGDVCSARRCTPSKLLVSSAKLRVGACMVLLSYAAADAAPSPAETPSPPAYSESMTPCFCPDLVGLAHAFTKNKAGFTGKASAPYSLIKAYVGLSFVKGQSFLPSLHPSHCPFSVPRLGPVHVQREWRAPVLHVHDKPVSIGATGGNFCKMAFEHLCCECV